MFKQLLKGLLIGGLIWLGVAGITACTGNTDGGSAADEDLSGTQYVDGNGNTGTFSLDVVETDLSVSEMTGFTVRVVNASGTPVKNIQVSCDTEEGLAIIEPTTGKESTDSNGSMSGKLGCAAPGSFLVGCRLPVGVGRREFVTIKCSGPVPTGFNGFGDGVAGGGLGGGTSIDDDGGQGGTDTSGVRISSIEFLDDGEVTDSAETTTSIDVVQGLCGTNCGVSGSSCTAEPFFDSYLKIKVVNNTNQQVTFSSLTYSIPNGTGAGTSTFNSDPIALIGEATVDPDGGESTFFALFLDAINPGDKVFNGSSSAIGDDFGFRNVTVRLSGSNGLGDEITLRAATAASFDNFNSCSN